jgi:hypothetical protein
VLAPSERCPDCGGVLRLVGEDVAEILVGPIHQLDRALLGHRSVTLVAGGIVPNDRVVGSVAKGGETLR